MRHNFEEMYRNQELSVLNALRARIRSKLIGKGVDENVVDALTEEILAEVVESNVAEPPYQAAYSSQMTHFV